MQVAHEKQLMLERILGNPSLSQNSKVSPTFLWTAFFTSYRHILADIPWKSTTTCFIGYIWESFSFPEFKASPLNENPLPVFCMFLQICVLKPPGLWGPGGPEGLWSPDSPGSPEGLCGPGEWSNRQLRPCGQTPLFWKAKQVFFVCWEMRDKFNLKFYKISFVRVKRERKR